MAKSRVTPLEPISIPCLELTAAVISVNVAAMLKGELDINNIKSYYYTESEIVISITMPANSMCTLATVYSISETTVPQETGSASQEKKAQPMKLPAV